MPTKLAKRNIKTDLEALKPYLGSRSTTRGYGSAITWENGYPTYDLRYVRLNKILLCSSGTVAQYDGDDTGLALALAAAISGDTVLVIPGTYTSSHTVPSGVSLVGASTEESPASSQVSDVVITGQVSVGSDGTVERISIIRSVNDATTAYGVHADIVSGETIYIHDCHIRVTQAGAGSGYAVNCKYGTASISYSTLFGTDGDVNVTTEWWEPAPGAVAVYVAKGAASLADSYIDLTGNGNDAYPGVAPGWNATDGWIFTGSEWLDTPVVPSMAARSMVLYCQADAEHYIKAGYRSSIYTRRSLYLARGYEYDPPEPSDWQSQMGWGSGGALLNSRPTSEPDVATTVAVGGQAIYFNGSPHTTGTGISTVSNWSGSALGSSEHMYIGDIHNDRIGGADGGQIYALAIYNTNLTADEIASIHAAMIAL